MATRLKPATVEDALNEIDVTRDGLAKLREPFPPNQISKLPKPTKKQTDEVKADFKKGVRCQICGAWHHPDVVHLDYVGHAALTDRLLDADPTWSWEPVGFDPATGLPALNGGLWIRLTVCGVTRYGFGAADGKSGGDAIKEMIGDALRNAAMRFGAALDLWHKGDLHADHDPATGEVYDEPKHDNGHAARMAEAKDAPFPLGPAKNKTALKDMGRTLWADVMACEDNSALDALLTSHKALIDQLQEALPAWWSGGSRPVDGGGTEQYEGLGQVIERLQRDFDAIMENGTDWNGAPR